MREDDGSIAELEERLRRYPAGRYPVQHATLQFHLGVALADRGALAPAEAALATAARLFPRDGLPAEHGKALNALGAVLRMAGRHEDAAPVLRHAAAAFARAGLSMERGAALFNVGLVCRDAHDDDAAADALTEARSLLESAGALRQAAAAARELAAMHLVAGRLDAARRDAADGGALARRAGDDAAVGTLANLLGLAELAAGRLQAAVDAFGVAIAAHPRSVRPADHAMAKANLALAHERLGDLPRARLNARQALGVSSPPPPVSAQAAGVLERAGRGEPDEVVALIASAPADRRPSIVRDEIARWLDAGRGTGRAEAGAWIDGQLARGALAVELAEAWVGAALELPPEDMRIVLRDLVEALREREPEAQEAFRAQIGMAAARFHVPQLMRLRGELNAIAEQLGERPAWS